MSDDRPLSERERMNLAAHMRDTLKAWDTKIVGIQAALSKADLIEERLSRLAGYIGDLQKADGFKKLDQVIRALEKMQRLGLRGATGPAGPAGPVGPQGREGARGSYGDTGRQGDRGPAGPQGPQGSAGRDGTLVAIKVFNDLTTRIDKRKRETRQLREDLEAFIRQARRRLELF